MNKSNVEVKMSLADYEELVNDSEAWLSKYTELRRVILKHFRLNPKGGYIHIGSGNSTLEEDLLTYLNSQD